MKIGSICMAVAILSVLGLTQGCVTTESQGSGRGAGAKNKGFYKAPHKGKEKPAVTKAEWEEEFGPVEENESLYSDDITSSDDSTYMEPSQGAAQYGETEIYIVQKGDVLSQIAVDCDTTTANLVEMNGLSNPDVLYVGQELRVPKGSKGTTTKPSGGSIKAGGTYTIQKGDTLSEIAVAAGVTIDDLRSVNGIKGDIIMAGEELTIPAYGTVPSTSRSSSSSSSSSSTTTSEPEPEPVMETSVEPEPAPLAFDDPAAEPVADTGAIVVDEVMYPGETLDDKARQYGVSKAEIMRLNGITDESQIKEGQTIRIPVAD